MTMPDLGTILYYLGLWFLVGLVLQEARDDPRTIRERLAALLPLFLVVHLSFLFLLFAWQRQTLKSSEVKNPNLSILPALPAVYPAALQS